MDFHQVNKLCREPSAPMRRREAKMMCKQRQVDFPQLRQQSTMKSVTTVISMLRNSITKPTNLNNDEHDSEKYASRALNTYRPILNRPTCPLSKFLLRQIVHFDNVARRDPALLNEPYFVPVTLCELPQPVIDFRRRYYRSNHIFTKQDELLAQIQPPRVKKLLTNLINRANNQTINYRKRKVKALVQKDVFETAISCHLPMKTLAEMKLHFCYVGDKFVDFKFERKEVCKNINARYDKNADDDYFYQLVQSSELI